jgi:hypothetical protein
VVQRQPPRPRGIAAPFEHDFLSTSRGRHDFIRFGQPVLAGRRMQERHPDSPWANFLGPNPPPPDAGRKRDLIRKHTARTPTCKDRMNRTGTGNGRIITGASRPQKNPRPKNVVWQKGRQTGQRHRGK